MGPLDPLLKISPPDMFDRLSVATSGSSVPRDQMSGECADRLLQARSHTAACRPGCAYDITGNRSGAVRGGRQVGSAGPRERERVHDPVVQLLVNPFCQGRLPEGEIVVDGVEMAAARRSR